MTYRVLDLDVPPACSLPIRAVCSAGLPQLLDTKELGDVLPSPPLPQSVQRVGSLHLPVTTAPRMPSSLPCSSLCSLHPPILCHVATKGLAKIRVHCSIAQTRQPCLAVPTVNSPALTSAGHPPTRPRSSCGAWSCAVLLAPASAEPPGSHSHHVPSPELPSGLGVATPLSSDLVSWLLPPILPGSRVRHKSLRLLPPALCLITSLEFLPGVYTPGLCFHFTPSPPGLH